VRSTDTAQTEIIARAVANQNPAGRHHAKDPGTHPIPDGTFVPLTVSFRRASIGERSNGDVSSKEVQMAQTVAGVLLAVALISAIIVGIFGPVTVMGVMFWNWHKELGELARVRQARTTQIR
jgi:hypothetical protein